MVVPIENVSPELWVDVRVCVPELSVAVGGVRVTLAVAKPLDVLADWLLGHPLMTGSSLS